MLKRICIRWIYNFSLYLNKRYYQQNHPDGVSSPSLFQRIRIAWKLRNEPTFNERLKAMYEKEI